MDAQLDRVDARGPWSAGSLLRLSIANIHGPAHLPVEYPTHGVALSPLCVLGSKIHNGQSSQWLVMLRFYKSVPKSTTKHITPALQ